MKINKNLNINYLNEAMLLSTFAFNSEAYNDDTIFFRMNELNVSKENIEKKYPSLKEFLIKTRTATREVCQEYSFLEDVFIEDKINGFPNLIYFIMYGDFEETINYYTREEFYKIYKEEFEDNLKTLGEFKEINDYISIIDTVRTFNNVQKFTLLKLLNNTNGIFDKLYDFIVEIEKIIKDNIYLIEDLFNKSISQMNINYIRNIEEFYTIENIIDNYNVKEINLSFRIYFSEKIGVSVFKKNKKLISEIYCGLIPYLLKDNFKNENNIKEGMYNVLTTISDETRFNIIHLLNNQKMYGRQIAEKLSLSTGTVSHHLTRLSDVKIVNSEIDGNRIYYSLNKKTINSIVDYFKNILGEHNE